MASTVGFLHPFPLRVIGHHQRMCLMLLYRLQMVDQVFAAFLIELFVNNEQVNIYIFSQYTIYCVNGIIVRISLVYLNIIQL